jgi:hypothetical protein
MLLRLLGQQEEEIEGNNFRGDEHSRSCLVGLTKATDAREVSQRDESGSLEAEKRRRTGTGSEGLRQVEGEGGARDSSQSSCQGLHWRVSDE